MQKIETVSRIQAEKAQEQLEEATATLQQRRETFDLNARPHRQRFTSWKFSGAAAVKPCCTPRPTLT